MADEQKPDGPPAPPPAGGAAKPAPPKPAAAAAGGHAAPPKPPATMAATPWESDLAHEIKERFGDRISETSTYLGQNFVVCKPEAAIPLVEFLKLEADFDYLVDITAVDWPKRAERFDLVTFSTVLPVTSECASRPASPTGTSRRPRWAST